jgi:hypothetical protein
LPGGRQVQRHFRWAVNLSISLAIPDLLTVSLQLWSIPDILPHLDHRQRIPEALVLDNSGVAQGTHLA